MAASEGRMQALEFLLHTKDVNIDVVDEARPSTTQMSTQTCVNMSSSYS